MLALVELRNAFQEQCITNNYSLSELPQELLNNDIDLSLFVEKDKFNPKDFQRPLDDSKSILEEYKVSRTPVFGCLYTTSTTTYESREVEAQTKIIPDESLKEFELCRYFVKDYLNFMLLTKHPNFSALSSYVNSKLPIEHKHSCQIVPTLENPFHKYLECVERFYLPGWVTFYIDYRLVTKYELDYSRILEKMRLYFNNLIQKQVQSHQGVAYYLNSRYTSNMNFVYILCPGVVIGHTFGMLKYGTTISDIMHNLH